MKAISNLRRKSGILFKKQINHLKPITGVIGVLCRKTKKLQESIQNLKIIL